MAEKTNAVRLCDTHGAVYQLFEYDSEDGALDGVSVASKIGKPPEMVFKTLVTQGQSGQFFVFLVPVAESLNLKKAAKAVNEKFVEMIPMKDLLKITGYVKGGCSPIGMKKHFRTFIDETLILVDEIVFSAGRIGLQLMLSVGELEKILVYETADLLE